MKKAIALALVVGAIAVPAASASGSDHRSDKGGNVEYVFKGVVSANASAVSVDVANARGLTKHARKSLAGATTFTVKLDAGTKIRGKHGKVRNSSALIAGARVEIIIRAPRGTAVANLPAARKVVVRGAGKPVVIEPPVVEPPVVEPPVVEPPVIMPPVIEPPIVVDPPVIDEPIFIEL